MLFIVVAYVLLNLLVDVLYAVLDPRIRHSRPVSDCHQLHRRRDDRRSRLVATTSTTSWPATRRLPCGSCPCRPSPPWCRRGAGRCGADSGRSSGSASPGSSRSARPGCSPPFCRSRIRRSDFTALAQGPSWDHLMGTDDLGRDVFAAGRLRAPGSRWPSASSRSCSASFVGGLFGLLAGYFRRRTESRDHDGRRRHAGVPGPRAAAVADRRSSARTCATSCSAIGDPDRADLHPPRPGQHARRSPSASSCWRPAPPAPATAASCSARCCPTWSCR